MVSGIIRIPSGSGPFPAVLISHGKGGSASGFSAEHAAILVNWGFACIGPSYTHEGTNVNPSDNEGYCPENSRRARRCIEILGSISSVDISRLALFGHSQGSFVTGGLTGELGAQVKAACISAGGTSGMERPDFASPTPTEVAGITAPFLMFHGTADTTVPEIQSGSLQTILNRNNVPNKRLLYQGINHDIVSSNVKRADIHAIMRAWFTQHGVLAFAGNTAPRISAGSAVTVIKGTASAPIAVTLDDTEAAASSLTLSAFSTDDTLLPSSAITLGGSGANRTMTLTPPSGQTGTVEVALVVDDGQLSAVTYMQVTIRNPPEPVTNFRPEVSWIADQRTTPGAAVNNIGFTVSDVETPASSLTVTATSSNTTLLPESGITLGGAGTSRTVSLAPASNQSGVSTITLTVSDGVKSCATAFTLTAAGAAANNTTNTPPTISSIASEVIAKNAVFGPVVFVVKDAEQQETTLTVTASSSNLTLVPAANITLSGAGYGRMVTVTPAADTTGRASITLTVSDGSYTSSCAFVLDVVDGNTLPAINALPGVVNPALGSTPQPVRFTIADAESDLNSLRITATSSNTTLTPVNGQTGAATVTLLLRDADLTQRAELLYVVTDSGTAAAQFSRPRGVYVLDSGGVANYQTTFGKNISKRDDNIRGHSFVDGFTLRVAWSDVESSSTPGDYDFFIIKNLLSKLPAGQKLSVIIVPDDPAYIASTPGVETWTDAGKMRATPWDPYLRQRRRALLQARTLQDEFPGKFVQTGFWSFTDLENASYGGVAAADWIRQQLLAEFNGATRPRVGFFMENLAAKRSGPRLDPYSATPVTAFASQLFAARDATWNGFQMLGSWTNPFNDNHVSATTYGTPNDAIEAAFNAYRSEYTEVYIGDIDNIAFQPALQRWHDFYATAATTNTASDEDHDGLPLAWEKRFGLSPTLANSASDDSDHDGVPLLLEYAFNLSPVAMSIAGMPTSSTVVNASDGLTYLHYFYIRRTDAPQLSYTVEVSDNLISWQSGTDYTQEISASPTGDGVTELVTARVLPAITPSNSKKFVRVKVATH
ncbi:MAG: hypothetical protein EBS01_07535 [Verrucomicrobia bacterium]|nr:hypothetical protein [Verrucomicrobiota bacterium]